MLFDILENLEWYVGLYPSLQRVIGIMDRSLPYQDDVGLHEVDGITYEVLTSHGDSKGKLVQAKKTHVFCILEGEELFSLIEDGEPSVVLMATEGRFVILREGQTYKSSPQMANDRNTKKVLFTL